MDELDNLLARLMDKTIAAHGPSYDIIEVGPLVAVLHRTDPLMWLSYVLPRPERRDEAVTPEMLAELSSLFRSRQRVLRFEFFKRLFPRLGERLESAGLVVQAEAPLMLCGPQDFAPFAAEAFEVCRLDATAPDQLIAEYITTAMSGFGMTKAPSEDDIAERRRQLADGMFAMVYARIDGEMVGVGAISLGNDELVGVATLPAHRRKGVASTVSSRLVADHFARGGALVWLSAADVAAVATYRKIGFRHAGIQLNYIERGASESSG